jgi:hypothetical protein
LPGEHRIGSRLETTPFARLSAGPVTLNPRIHMRLSRALPSALLLALASSLFTGCASHTANGKNHTVVLGGLYESHEGAYSQQTAAGIPVNSDKPLPGSDLSGNKVSILWGLFTYRDQ